MGHYKGVTGFIQGFRVSLLCVYAPPTLSVDFTHTLHKRLNELPLGIQVVGGDFNKVLDTGLDRPSGDGTIGAFSWPTPLAGFARMAGLIVAWRWCHPGERSYSFFSAAHNSFSKLDTFMVPGPDCSRILDSHILAWAFRTTRQ